jgi:hypothetical protein
MKYEYRVDTHTISNRHDNILEPLNAAGADGWQVIDILWLNSNFVVVTMMRGMEERQSSAASTGPSADRKSVGPALNLEPVAPVDTSNA